MASWGGGGSKKVSVCVENVVVVVFEKKVSVCVENVVVVVFEKKVSVCVENVVVVFQKKVSVCVENLYAVNESTSWQSSNNDFEWFGTGVNPSFFDMGFTKGARFVKFIWLQ